MIAKTINLATIEIFYPQIKTLKDRMLFPPDCKMQGSNKYNCLVWRNKKHKGRSISFKKNKELSQANFLKKLHSPAILAIKRPYLKDKQVNLLM